MLLLLLLGYVLSTYGLHPVLEEKFDVSTRVSEAYYLTIYRLMNAAKNFKMESRRSKR